MAASSASGGSPFLLRKLHKNERVARDSRRKPEEVWLSLGRTIRWRDASKPEPSTLLDFKGEGSFEVRRLKNGATEEDIDKYVRPFMEHGTWKTHPGVLVYRKSKGIRRSLVLLASDKTEQEGWLNLFRMMFSPLQLIQKYVLSITQESSKVNMRFSDYIPSVPPEEVTFLNDVIVQPLGNVGNLLVLKKDLLQEFMESIEIVADLSRYFLVGGAACILVSSSIKMAYVVSVALKARQELPQVHNKLCKFASTITLCLQDSIKKGNPSRIEEVIKKLNECLDMLDEVEDYILKKFASQAILRNKFAENVEERFRRIRVDIHIEDLERRVNQTENEIKELRTLPQEPPDEYKCNSELPHRLFRAIHDFEEESSPEKQLLDELLKDTTDEFMQSKNCVAAVGMGGAGKTTALLALCKREDIEENFPGGVYFIQFGENTGAQNFIESISNAIRGKGGTKVAQEMMSASSVRSAVKIGSKWLENRKVLLVCDDIWPSSDKDNDFGFRPELQSILQCANPASKLLISSRSERMAFCFRVVKFEELPEPRSRLILFMDLEVEESYSAEIEQYISVILKKCGGLPLALSIANRWIVNEVGTNRTSKAIVNAVQLYANELNKPHAGLHDVTHEEYGGVYKILQITLDHLEKWGCSPEVRNRETRTVEFIDSCENMGN